jgi:hypothetical protein
LVNGLATLDTSCELIILADSINGQVQLLDGNTGAYELLLQGAELLPGPHGELGVNGLKVLPKTCAGKVEEQEEA